MYETKECATCGYTGSNKHDDFFDYRKNGEELSSCYFCVEMAQLEGIDQKKDVITYEMFSRGLHWILNHIRDMKDQK